MARKFTFVTRFEITAKNRESALKKLAKALYSGRSHYDKTRVDEAFFQDHLCSFFGSDDLPKTEQVAVLLKSEKLTLRKSASVGKDKKRDMAAKLREIADQLEG